MSNLKTLINEIRDALDAATRQIAMVEFYNKQANEYILKSKYRIQEVNKQLVLLHAELENGKVLQ